MSSTRRPEKGKPRENAGRKATGLSPKQNRIGQQGCLADAATSQSCIALGKTDLGGAVNSPTHLRVLSTSLF
jgi:hypothetical protein